jgi:hypothetical protein
MAEIPKDMRFLLFGKGARWHAKSSFVLDFLGLACLIVAIVADAINRTLGLETTHWFILAPTLGILGLWAWLTALNAAKEG